MGSKHSICSPLETTDLAKQKNELFGLWRTFFSSQTSLTVL